MKAIHSAYFHPNPLKKDARSTLAMLGISLAAAGVVLFLQSLVYASSIQDLLEAGHNLWWVYLEMMLKSLVVWAIVLGVVFALRFVNQPTARHGWQFWVAVSTGFVLGLVLPFLFVLESGVVIFIPLGLLSLLIVDIFQFATLQFGWLVATYIVFLWFVVGVPPLLAATFGEGKWYFKFLAILLIFQLLLDILQAGRAALTILLQNSIWRTDNTALLLAIIGSLLLTVVIVRWSLRGRSVLTIVYAIAAIYVASIASGNFSELLFGWGELPSAVLTFLAPLAYLQVTKWILKRWDRP